MVNVLPNSNQSNKQVPFVRIMTPANVAIPAQKPIQAIDPQIPAAQRNSFTPSSVRLPASQPIPIPKPQQKGKNNV